MVFIITAYSYAVGVVGSLSCEIVIGIMGSTSPINLICLSKVIMYTVSVFKKVPVYLNPDTP